ncbi:MAG TPA: glycosyltransferase, partial [Candidatus Paceibacterota bacterium]|nr:glycosyltransferase [Candidatus Paceibacterota bacterium]
QNKDFAAAKKTFLWFGGGGAVHKGLDLVLEAFATLPNLTLHIVGPVAAEEDFVKAYEKELALPNVHLHGRPKIDANGFMTIDGAPFSDIADACGALVYLSASEGTSGAVVQAMHAGLYPIITPESGIDSSAPSIAIAHPSVESVAAAVRAFSSLPSENIREKAKAAWTFARETYTKEQFTKTYSDFLDSIHI